MTAIETSERRTGPRHYFGGRVGRQRQAVVGVYLAALALCVVDVLTNPSTTFISVIWSLLSLSVVSAVAAYGQTVIVLIGGLDLSIPYVMTVAAVILTETSHGTAASDVLGVVLALGAGLLVGILNGVGVTLLKLPAVVMTLAMNVILEGAVLVATNGTPTGQVPGGLVSLMTARGIGGMPTSVWVLVGIAVIGIALLRGTVLGRRLYGTGSNSLAARYSGISVTGTTIRVYAIGGLCSALAGILLAAFAGQSYLGMGDSYLLPSIAAVVIGGTAVIGGRGGYEGTLGGVLFLTSIGFVLSGPSSDAIKMIVFGGAIIISAILFNRATDREPS